MAAPAHPRHPPHASAVADLSAQWMLDDDVLSDDVEPVISAAESIAPLSFKVYTLAELEQRGESPEAIERANRVVAAAQRRALWGTAARSIRGLGSAALSWTRTRNELGMRDSPRLVLREPFDRATGDARAALRTVDWKRHGITAGIVATASVVFLFAILITAELTDDLKPGSGSHLASAAALEVAPPRAITPATQMAALGMQPVAPLATVVVPDPSLPTTSVTPYAADEDPPAPPPVKRAPAKKAKAKGKLTFRSADAIFNP